MTAAAAELAAMNVTQDDIEVRFRLLKALLNELVRVAQRMTMQELKDVLRASRASLAHAQGAGPATPSTSGSGAGSGTSSSFSTPVSARPRSMSAPAPAGGSSSAHRAPPLAQREEDHDEEMSPLRLSDSDERYYEEGLIHGLREPSPGMFDRLCDRAFRSLTLRSAFAQCAPPSAASPRSSSVVTASASALRRQPRLPSRWICRTTRPWTLSWRPPSRAMVWICSFCS